jgi:hypothetical protein
MVARGQLYLAQKYLPIGDVAEVGKSVGDGLRTQLHCALRRVYLEGGEGKAEESGED